MKIRNIAVSSAILLAMGSAYAGEMAAPKAPIDFDTEEPFSLGAELSAGYDSKYSFRGFDLGDNLIWTDLNIAIPVTDTIEFTLGAWYASLADNAFDELDIYGGVSADLGAFQVGVGLTWYYFPRAGNPIRPNDVIEPGVNIGTSVGPVDLSLGYYFDTEISGHYIELVSQSTIEISDTIALVPGASISYAQDYYGVSGFNNIGVSLALPISLTDSATLTPYVAGSFAFDALEEVGQDDYIYGGVALSVKF